MIKNREKIILYLNMIESYCAEILKKMSLVSAGLENEKLKLSYFLRMQHGERAGNILEVIKMLAGAVWV